MLIGIDASRANREHKTGVEWYSYYLIKSLARLDSENQYVLYTDTPLQDGLLDLNQEESECCHDLIEPQFDKQGFQIIKSPYNNFKAKILKWPFTFFWTQGRLSLEMLFKAPDILFIPAHALPIIHPKKSIVTIHDVGFKVDQKFYQKEKIGPKLHSISLLVKLFSLGKYEANTLDYHDWSTTFALKHACKIITISNFSKQELLKYYKTDPSKIDVVYNGYNNKVYCQYAGNEDARKNILASHGINGDYIFYAGRLEKKKNIANLIEAFAIMKQAHPEIRHKLCLIGVAGYGYDEIKYLIKEFGLDDDVIVTGWVKENDMSALFSGATAMIFPSNYEGFGIPVLQAMACGVPVATSNTASLPEVGGQAAVYFDPLSVYDIAEKIALIINDKNLRLDLIERGKQRAKEFSWENCARETLRLFND